MLARVTAATLLGSLWAVIPSHLIATDILHHGHECRLLLLEVLLARRTLMALLLGLELVTLLLLSLLSLLSLKQLLHVLLLLLLVPLLRRSTLHLHHVENMLIEVNILLRWLLLLLLLLLLLRSRLLLSSHLTTLRPLLRLCESLHLGKSILLSLLKSGQCSLFVKPRRTEDSHIVSGDVPLSIFPRMTMISNGKGERSESYGELVRIDRKWSK